MHYGSDTVRREKLAPARNGSKGPGMRFGLNGEVLDLAADLAAWEGGELHVAHAWVPYGVTVLSSRMSEESLSKYIEGGRRSAQERMADL